MDPPVSQNRSVHLSNVSTPSSGPKLHAHAASSYAPSTLSTDFGKWTVSVTKGPILSSQCTCNTELARSTCTSSRGDFSAAGDMKEQIKCAFCRCEPLLTLKHLPNMVFAQNRLVISSPDGSFGIEFNGIDAVNSIGDQPCGGLQVASAGVWQEARSEALKTYESHAVIYDWTYTPSYKGTVIGQTIRTEPSSETLDMALLSRRDPVLFFEELQLFADELDDNGCSELDLKIRIVESYLFVLMRFYLRVDHVAVKLQDVRLMFLKGQNYMLREVTLREAKTRDLPADVSPMDPVQLWSALKPIKTVVEKLSFS